MRSYSEHPPIAPGSNEFVPLERAPWEGCGGGQEGEGTHHPLGWLVGEFGSVREAQLKQEDGSFVKVAVKMLKGEWRSVRGA